MIKTIKTISKIILVFKIIKICKILHKILNQILILMIRLNIMIVEQYHLELNSFLNKAIKTILKIKTLLNVEDQLYLKPKLKMIRN